MLMICLSSCSKGLERLLSLFPDWFGVEKVQASVIFVGAALLVLGIIVQVYSGPDSDETGPNINQFYFAFGTNQPPGSSPTGSDQAAAGKQPPTGPAQTRSVGQKILALILISIGTSILGAGIILKVTQARSNLQASLQNAGVVFVGDRVAFDEVIGWDNWIRDTHRCSELIIIGKDQFKWAEESAEALGALLTRGVQASFIFQGTQCNDSLQRFWNELKQKDAGGKFDRWRRDGKLLLYTNSQTDGNYGYYWNGTNLIVKLYFEVEQKIQAPLIVFDVRFAAGKFDYADFSPGTCEQYVPLWQKKRMLLQAGRNIWTIKQGATLLGLA
jgi:uncharacterized membrane protein